MITEAERLIKEAGFRHLDVVDSHADLNAYSQMEGASCCNAPTSTSESSCCGSSDSKSPLGADFLDFLSKVNINEYAASVKFFAVK